MPIFTAVYVSGDNRRVATEPVKASDIDRAAECAIASLEGPTFGAGSSWFVAAIVQEDHLETVAAALENER